MKLVKLSSVAFALVWLAGCNTLGLNGGNDGLMDGEEGVIVEDRGVSAGGIGGEGIDGTDIGDGTETQVIVGDGAYQGDAIDDPANALSNRVVYFEYDSSSVREQDNLTLQAHAAYLANNPTARVRLEGHTDQRGSREYNLALGERRAIAIRQILMIQGANINQFQVTSFGEERPQNEGDGEENWQNNRRVELIYTGR
jgi:peptidoglycan-associated lipoprotein